VKNPILYKFLAKNFAWIVIITIVNIAVGWSRGLGASYVGQITDLLTLGAFDGVMRLIFIGAVLMFTSYFMRWLGAAFCHFLVHKLGFETRLKIMKHLQKISYGKFEQHSHGQLQSIMRNDVDDASQIIFMLFSRILNNVFLFAFSVYFMFIVNARATIVVIIICLVVGVVNKKILEKLRVPQKAVRKSVGDFTAVVENIFNTTDTIKTFSAKDYVMNFFRKEKQVYNTNNIKATKVDAGRRALYDFVNNLSIYISLFYLGNLAFNEVLTVGEVFVFIYLLNQIFVPIEVIFRWMSRLVGSNTSWERIYEVLGTPTEAEAATLQNASSIEGAQKLEINGITFSYDDKVNVLNDVNISIELGKFNILAGESGSGKSTVLKILLGLYHSPQAKYMANNNEIGESLAGLVSFAPSDKQLFNMSIYENLCLGSNTITRQACLDLAEQLGIGDWISSLPNGIDSVISENSSNISGGQQQTLNNMRAILNAFDTASGVPIIILDEPFSALDKDKEEKLLKLLHQLKNEKLLLFTSHRESTIDGNIVMLT